MTSSEITKTSFLKFFVEAPSYLVHSIQHHNTNVQTRNVAKASGPSMLASPLVDVVAVVFVRIFLLGDVTVKTRLCAGMTSVFQPGVCNRGRF